MKANTVQVRLEHIRHSLAHLLAAAVLTKFPKTKLGIGPVIEHGFYYDFKFEKDPGPEILPELEKEMRSLINARLSFHGGKVSTAEAKRLFSARGGSSHRGESQPFKLDLIREFIKKKKPLTVYKTGEVFLDLCRGGHVKNTAEINPDAFTLTHLAGAYWRGNEKNPQLTRIYGLAFESKKELEEYLRLLEEAKARDHKKLGEALGLFMFHETSPGIPYWLPPGTIVLNELIAFWREEHKKRGYHEISSPLVNKRELWETSGHWEHYKDDMFLAHMGKNEVYGVKPMNCPNAMVVFGAKPRSYRDLPLRLSDTDILHRYERSGTLHGLLRARAFRQDDSHNFVTEEQIGEECDRIFEIVDLFYGIFKLPFRYRLGTRPEKFMGTKSAWDRAETALATILAKHVGKKHFDVLEGDGAFYGPKVDIIIQDALHRDWQMGTIQLDFQQPMRFNLKYTAADGSQKTPIAIHRVIYGSLERFVAILLEHWKGAFPLWLTPVQAVVLPVGEKFSRYAENVFTHIRDSGIRAEILDSDNTLPKRIREAELQKIPYILVVGEKEKQHASVNVRNYKKGQQGEMKLNDLLEKLQREIREKSL